MKHFEFEATCMPEVKLIHKSQLTDDRGYLSRFFCQGELAEIGWNNEIAQINYTFTKNKGTIRGLHFQEHPHEEIKIVSCLNGSIYDVAVDIRPNSPTFLKWVGKVISEENWCSIYIPEGFAHGFQSLEDDVELLYLHSHRYVLDSERGINALDNTLNIRWPLDIYTRSDRDKNLPLVSQIWS